MQAGDSITLEQLIPRDPRARRALDRISVSRSVAARWPATASPPGQLELNRLYSVIRWVGPRVVHLEGLPDPRISLIVAAAAADSGCRRIRCPLLLQSSGSNAEGVWQVLQDAGLDWLLRSASLRCDVQSLLVLALPAAEQIERLQALFFEHTGRQAVLGLFDGCAVRAHEHRKIHSELQRLGLQPILPSSSRTPFWLAVNSPFGTPFDLPEL